MPDSLPPIHINVTGSPANFFEIIVTIAKASGRFIVEVEHDAMGTNGLSIANLRLLKSSGHKGLGGQLIIHPGATREACVEIRAERWIPEDPPNYETYVAAAKDLIAPLLSAYNKKTGRRHRMTIPTKDKLEPKLSPKSNTLFKNFTNLANKSCLHPLDWRRFYSFVRDSQMRNPLCEEDMARLLRKEGFSDQHAREIANVYGHLLEFKQLI